MFFIKYRGLIISLILFVALIITPTKAFQQTDDARLIQYVELFDSHNSSIAGQLIEFGQYMQMPMGIELPERIANKNAKRVQISNTNVRSAIVKILQEYPDIAFELDNGVLHVFTPSLIKDQQNFLNLKISQFAVANNNLFDVSNYLRCGILLKLYPEYGCAGGIGYGIPRNDGFDIPNINLVGNSLTVRQILNKIITIQGNALWVVRLEDDIKTSQIHWDFVPLKVSKNIN